MGEGIFNKHEHGDGGSENLPPKSVMDDGSFDDWMNSNMPLRYIGETNEDYDKRVGEFREVAEEAVKSRQVAESLRNSGLKSEFVKGGGEPTSIDAGRYHEWLDKNVFSRLKQDESKMQEWRNAAMKIDQGIELFNSQSAEKRKKYLETGDASIFFPSNLSENARKANEDLLSYLKEEKVFLRQEDGKYTIDADFAPIDVGIEHGRTEIEFDLGNYFEKDNRFRAEDVDRDSYKTDDEYAKAVEEKKAEAEGKRAEALFDVDRFTFNNLNDDERKIAQFGNEAQRAELFGRKKKEWYEGLDEAEKKRRIELLYKDEKAAVEKWNSIPEDNRLAYLETGFVAALAGEPADKLDSFDPGEKKGRELTAMMTVLRNTGIFGQKEAPDRANHKQWRDEQKRESDNLQTKIDVEKRNAERKKLAADLAEQAKAEAAGRESRIEILKKGGMEEAAAIAQADQEIHDNIKRKKQKHLKAFENTIRQNNRSLTEEEVQAEAQKLFEKKYQKYLDVKDEAYQLRKKEYIERFVHDHYDDEKYVEAGNGDNKKPDRNRLREIAEKQFNEGIGDDLEAVAAMNIDVLLDDRKEEEDIRKKAAKESDALKAKNAKSEKEREEKINAGKYDKDEVEKIKAEIPGISDQDAAYLSIVEKDDAGEAAYLRKMFQMQGRKEGDTPEDDFEGETGESRKVYYVHLDENSRKAFSEKEAALKFMEEQKIDPSQLVEAEIKYGDYSNMPKEDAITYIGRIYPRREGEEEGAWKDRIERIYAKTIKAEVQSRIDDKISGSKRFGAFMKANGYENLDIDKVIELEAKYEGTLDWKRDELDKMRGDAEFMHFMGANFEIPENTDDGQAAALYEKAHKGMLDREAYNMLLADNNFKSFLIDNYDNILFDKDKDGRYTDRFLSAELAGQVLEEWNRMHNEVVFTSISVGAERDRMINRLAEEVFRQKEAVSSRWGIPHLWRNLFRNKTMESYRKKAAELIDSGEKKPTSGFWGNIKDIDGYINAGKIASNNALERIRENPEGLEIADSEKMSAYRIQMKDSKPIVVKKNGDNFEEVDMNGSEKPVAELILAVNGIMTEYLASNQSGDEQGKVKTKIAELTKNMSPELREKMSLDSMSETIFRLGERAKYGIDVSRATEMLRFVNMETGLTDGTRRLFDNLVKRKLDRLDAIGEARRSTAGLSLEKLRNDYDIEVVEFSDLKSDFENAIKELKDNPGSSDARNKVVGLLSKYGNDGKRHLYGLVNYGADAANGVKEHRQLWKDAYDVMAKEVGSSLLVDKILEQMHGIKEEADKKKLASIRIIEGGPELDINLGIYEMEEKSYGNSSAIRYAVGAWDKMQTDQKIAMMLGMTSGTPNFFTLVSAGYIKPLVNIRSIPSKEGKYPARRGEEFDGINENSQITEINKDYVKAILIDVRRELPGSAKYEDSVIRDAIDKWNNADEMWRRMYLYSVNGIPEDPGVTSGELKELAKVNVELKDDELKKAADILRDVQIIDRTPDYGKSKVPVDEVLRAQSMLGGDANRRAELASAVAEWRKIAKENRDRIIDDKVSEFTDNNGVAHQAVPKAEIDVFHKLQSFGIWKNVGPKSVPIVNVS